ncbi:MAG: hypothetical protein ACPGVO_22885 [Spirulinaceae cyanobacterium]
MNKRLLKEEFQDWLDWDWAQFIIDKKLGLIGDDLDFGAAKHRYWSNHKEGEMVMGILDLMAAYGILLRREEPDIQYRYNHERDRPLAHDSSS